MGEICRDSKDIHDGVFLVDFFSFLIFTPWIFFSDETEIREAYVLCACVHFVVFRFVGDGGGKLVTVGQIASSSRGHVPLSSLCLSEVFEHPVALPARPWAD